MPKGAQLANIRVGAWGQRRVSRHIIQVPCLRGHSGLGGTNRVAYLGVGREHLYLLQKMVLDIYGVKGTGSHVRTMPTYSPPDGAKL